MKKKYIFLIVTIIITVISLFFIYYEKTYSIIDNKEQLEDSIKTFVNRGNHNTIDNIDIKQELIINNKKYISFMSNNHLGYAVLIQGLNKKYKIDFSELGTNTFYYSVNNIDKSNYFIILGSNTSTNIDFITATFKGKIYKVTIPQQEYFISYCPIDNDINQKYPDSGVEIHYKNGLVEKH